MKNVFEKIVDGEIPSNKVLENDKFLAFHDINPKAPIHILIIPKKCYENFQEMDTSLMSEMSEFIKEVARKMGVDKSGYRLVCNCGENGGQEVPHLHFHLLGGTKLEWEQASGNNMKDGF
ncbi:histidine triad nucleotide-binding protein [Campylobacter geochelonis]|uniref:HIT family protein n=1 Tax=Campylobacter geochelonis TaxID=1780362 RepID=A0A128EFH7_9BACT|nr:histidine triad nucleotide-binding protein [Campylobacter geochelonis]QKF70910.1 histidine triad nucleotide-binding protein, Hint/PKCI branch [Campylobacter geochelonis]CZE46943.1 HIT family protein [Campylobacter geochelonis]CZE51243.1 HIT family protein [Campylobacter geochelonis]